MKGKMKIMNTRPHLTDDEIMKYMDFDGLLKQKDEALKEGRKLRRLRNHTLGLVILSVIPGIMLLKPFAPDESKTGMATASPPTAPAIIDSLEVTTPAAEQHAPPRARQTPVVSDSNSGNKTESDGNEAPREVYAREQEAPAAKNIYVQAVPVDGYPFLYEYFDNNIVYPRAALKDSIEGVVNLVFVIDTAGRPVDITVENSLGPLFDKEATRLIENMPPWLPASYNGNPVASKISLPVTFSINNISNH